jgi:hypothetical protein
MTIEAENVGSIVSEWNAVHQVGFFFCQKYNVYVVKMCTWQGGFFFGLVGTNEE